MRCHLITATTLAIAASALLTGCSGDSLEGTYLDAKEGRYMLVLGEDSTCGHQERTNPQAEIDDDCSWSRDGDELTFVGLMSYNVYGTVNDDGSITIPHQNHVSSKLLQKQES
ncbi:hypothetical protein QDX23_05215 [Auritidibacter ignavus]|uniref:hypothetical protein n=1 Tax=Auritidibacter ignavus TaxID=678932 RepID=UPI002447DEC3|nr:hypothetical protein [Auritidibacter ignavus]WGH91758.1 hypothetical protein QDX23_05215 [Auritidibacter ignavus]